MSSKISDPSALKRKGLEAFVAVSSIPLTEVVNPATLGSTHFDRVEGVRNLTVCIAAVCQQNDEKRIVLCSDWKGEIANLAGSETTDKLRFLPQGWTALMADTLSRAEELVAAYKTHIRGLGSVADEYALFTEMKKPAQKHKEAMIDDYVRQTLGMSYSQFLAHATNIPPESAAKLLDGIANIKLGASLILAGFAETPDENGDRERAPYLFVVQDNDAHEDVVSVQDQYAVIGSGAYVAIPAINQRAQDDQKSLMETIYTLYEAKRLSQIVPGVGEDTSIDVMEPNGKLWSLSDAGYERCEDLFREIGPKLNLTDKRAAKLFEIKAEFLEDEETLSLAAKQTPGR